MRKNLNLIEVVIVCFGIVLATFFYNNKFVVLKLNIVFKEKNINSYKEIVENNENIIDVYRENGEILKLNMDDYLIGVVSSEMPAEFNIEALKALAVAARTYALKTIKEGNNLTDSVSTQVYSSNEELKLKWGNDYEKYYNKIKEAVLSTSDLVIKYNDELISALYFSTSNGYTESSKEVFGSDLPYLKSVESLVDIDTTPYLKTTELDIKEVLNILGITSIDNIDIISKTETGRIKEIRINDKIYSGVEFRKLLNLRSTDFEIDLSSDKVRITTKGYGHGVGMSQYGANKLANNGYTYEKILKHYYTNVEIVSIND